ncbi:MAG: phosphoribosyl-AMP cyclohydrolase [Betaproteobacteria bacterium]
MEQLNNTSSKEWFQKIKWNEQGLIPVIAQEIDSNDVLMMAWMNHDALLATLEKGQAVYWSRSRKKLWHKGEESGHFQNIRGVYLDCDGDTLLIKVEQVGGIACHTGTHSCFFSELNIARETSAWKKISTK